MPSEVGFISRINDEYWPEPLKPEVLSWEILGADSGSVLILDDTSPSKVSVLCTSESVMSWRAKLHEFPSLDNTSEVLANRLTSVLEGLSPYAFVGEDGNVRGGWTCSTLWQAMHVMLLRDLDSKSTLRKCESRGCLEFFRVGVQSKSKYCSERCANRASTRIGRGQNP
jgi:hypothetical protein